MINFMEQMTDINLNTKNKITILNEEEHIILEKDSSFYSSVIKIETDHEETFYWGMVSFPLNLNLKYRIPKFIQSEDLEEVLSFIQMNKNQLQDSEQIKINERTQFDQKFKKMCQNNFEIVDSSSILSQLQFSEELTHLKEHQQKLKEIDFKKESINPTDSNLITMDIIGDVQMNLDEFIKNNNLMFINKGIENELKKRIISKLELKLNSFKTDFQDLQQTINTQNNQITEISSMNKEYENILIEIENKMIELESTNKNLLDEISLCKSKQEESLLFAELLQEENDLQKNELQGLNTKLINLIAEFEGTGDNELVKQLFAEEKLRIEQIQQLIRLKNAQEQKNQELEQIIQEFTIKDESEKQMKAEEIQNAQKELENAFVLRDKALALLGRKELEIDDLNVKITNLNTSLINLSEELNNAKKINNNNPEMLSKIESLEKQNENLASKIEIIMQEKSNLEKTIEELKKVNNNLINQKDDINLQNKELNNTKKLVEEQILNDKKTQLEINKRAIKIAEEFKKLKVNSLLYTNF